MCISQNLPHFVIASRYKRRGDPGSLVLPLRGTKAWEYCNGFVVNAPRNDDPVIYLNLNNNNMAQNNLTTHSRKTACKIFPALAVKWTIPPQADRVSDKDLHLKAVASYGV